MLFRSCYPRGASSSDGRLQEAMDRAIRNGQDQGIDGDLLVNVRIKRQIRYRTKSQMERHLLTSESKELAAARVDEQECWVVTGDLVRITGPKRDVGR